MNLQDAAARYAPHVLSVVRIVPALLFLEHGSSRLFGWPSPMPTPAPFSMYWFAGAALLVLGLFTRPAALPLYRVRRRRPVEPRCADRAKAGPAVGVRP
jgi:putative oxidoreductase